MLLTDNGLHTRLGRDRDPTEEDLARASAGLHGLGRAGWLCVAEGV